MQSGVFLISFKVFENGIEYCLERVIYTLYIISIETKMKEKMAGNKSIKFHASYKLNSGKQCHSHDFMMS